MLPFVCLVTQRLVLRDPSGAYPDMHELCTALVQIRSVRHELCKKAFVLNYLAFPSTEAIRDHFPPLSLTTVDRK